jgi:pimeloyl-ACP methyl ester carboxylesterase
MKSKILRYPFYFFLFIFSFVACDNGFDDVEVPSENEYLVESEFVTSYSESLINLTLTIASSQYSDISTILDEVSMGVKIYKIIYNTEFEGEELQASGIVCIPDQAGTYPILSYQNGTNTLHSAAPSVDEDSDLFKLLEMVGSTGFIIALPDYLGFGEADDMFHPYLHKESTVQSVVDMLRAVKEMVDADENIATNQDLYLSGYSQGGWATMAVQKAVETEYPTEFNLKASACGAGPYNLITVNEYVCDLAVYPNPYFLGYIFNSYLNLDMATEIDEVFQAPYAEKIPTLYDGTKSGGEINAELTTSMADLFMADYLSSWNSESKFSSVKDLLEENSVSAYATQTPTMILHGTEDDLVPPIVSTNIYNEYISLGVSTELVTLVTLEGHTHTSGIIPSGLASVMWFIELKEASL